MGRHRHSHEPILTTGQLRLVLPATVALLIVLMLSSVRIGAAQELTTLPIDLVTERLGDQDSEVRRAAALELGRRGAEAVPAIPALVEALYDRGTNVGPYAGYALSQIGAPAVPALAAALLDMREAVGVNAAMALGRIGPQARDAVPAMLDVLDYERVGRSYPARRAVIAALVNVAATDPSPLTAALARPEAGVRVGVAEVLGKIGRPVAIDAVPALGTLLNGDADEGVRAACATALGSLQPESVEAVPALRQALSTDASAAVRRAAAQALGSLGPLAKAALPELISALQDRRTVRGSPERTFPQAAEALGKIGWEAHVAIPDLVKASQLTDPWGEHRSADSALADIARALQDASGQLSGSELDQVIGELVQAEDELLERTPTDMRRTRRALEDRRSLQRLVDLGAVLGWLGSYPYTVGGITYVVLAAGLTFGMLWRRPLWLLKANDLAKPISDVPIPGLPSGVKIPLRHALLVGFFHYHPRVLDAWVAAHVETARSRFESKPTVRSRRVHVDVPVVLDGESVPRFSGKDVRSTFSKSLGCLLIWGEGGSGKTSLACQIARWAMAAETDRRICRHLMLPILIEHGLDADFGPGKDSLTAAVRRQLQDLVDAPEPISEELLERLLRRRRLLVIVDHLSEMPKAIRDKVQPSAPHFVANALIVTSRVDETTRALGGVTTTVITPLRVEGNRISSFMDAYLTRRQKRQLFDDPEFFDACGRLSSMVGTRSITVLLARLYADQMIAAREGRLDATLPQTIPDLMLSYVNELNHGVVEGRLSDRSVHRDAGVIAWECLKLRYRPTPARLDKVIAALGGTDAADRLKYLEERLHLIQTIQPAQDRVRIMLDPLAEYLAGLHLIERHGTDDAAWQRFLADADVQDGAPETIRGFLLAVLDSCVARRGEVDTPASLPDDLAFRVGIAGVVAVKPTDYLSIVVRKRSHTGPVLVCNVRCYLKNSRQEPVTIHWLEARLSDPQGSSFRLVSSLFYDGDMVHRKIADAHPISVPPSDAMSLGIQFVGPSSIRGYLWPAGRYHFDLQGWLTKERRPERPDLTTPCEIDLSERDASDLRSWSVASDEVWEAVGDPDNAVAVPVPIDTRVSAR